MKKRRYDCTKARIAGNIASGLVNNPRYLQGYDTKTLSKEAVALATAIVERIRRQK